MHVSITAAHVVSSYGSDIVDLSAHRSGDTSFAGDQAQLLVRTLCSVPLLNLGGSQVDTGQRKDREFVPQMLKELHYGSGNPLVLLLSSACLHIPFPSRAGMTMNQGRAVLRFSNLARNNTIA